MLHFDTSMTPSSNKPIELLVDSIRAEARDIMSFTLVAPDGGKLPPSGPGGHVEIALPNGLIRHYSMVNDCNDTDHYLISVGRTADSSGGSDFLHTDVRVGDKLQVTAVRNNFELDPAAKSYRFIAGGSASRLSCR
ncbi:ferredoxin reductase [Aquicoccus sp. G2-2]|uniref:ferredoxin reductase n=1 Tax=Aquicoccus sp. G2-2 TaxID=3092120 RepID=UPI002ADF440B|nr:ferredoxin reductase [Aquicoccus sp. G2-2]MEA1114791.1 ferredoxin reductase [Aquicoccus sp. G2-2]